MKSKIEIGKLGRLGRVSRGNHTWWIIDELNLIIEKQGEIIDYLNSQSQPEEGEHIKAHKEYLATSTQDTPEEWVEKLWDLIDEYQDGQGVTLELENIGKVNHFVQQLLEDKERSVLHDLIDDYIDPDDADTLVIDISELQRRLDKLNNKKK